MRLPTALPIPREPERIPVLLQTELVRTNQQVNLLSEGHVQAAHGARTSVPTSGTWAQGDFVRNATPTETGSPAYVVLGWLRITGGAGNVLNTDWVACRALTGN